ncbi:MAG: hypothetical protein IT452_10800 [Planctomycetia bacterium]|nr:hypothetical protein [Planctomycetia bacterium]
MPSPARPLLLDGLTGRILQADIRSERPREIDRIEAIDRQLAPLGFRPVGDLVCERFPDVLGRGYARDAGDAWGGLFFGLIETSFDFVTQWDGGFLMTTINGRGEGDAPKSGVYVTRLPGLGFDRLGELLERHAARAASLEPALGKPIRAEATLRAFAEAVDRGVARQLGKA